MSYPVASRPIEIGGVRLSRAYEYLDELRESGVTNMFGAAPYLRKEFECERDPSNQIVKAWMEDF